MTEKSFSEGQIAFILRQGGTGSSTADICRKAGISETTYYKWRKKYFGLTLPEMRRLRQLEEENEKLKKLVAVLSQDLPYRVP